MTKAELKEIIYNKRRISNLKERLRALQDAAEHITPTLSGMPHAPSTGDKMSGYAAEVDEVERLILEETLKLERLRLKAEAELEMLPAQQRMVMHLRYVEGMSWYKISKATRYTINHCNKIERGAIKRLSEMD